MLMIIIKEDLVNRDISCQWIERFRKVPDFPEFIYKFKLSPVKTPAQFFVDI